MTSRTEKISSLLQKEISLILIKLLSEEKFGLITIVHVDVSPDLSLAKIHVSAIKRDKFLVSELNKKKSKIMHELRPRLRMKRTPKLEFFMTDFCKMAF